MSLVLSSLRQQTKKGMRESVLRRLFPRILGWYLDQSWPIYQGRLRARRRVATYPHGHHVVGGSLSSPSKSTFSILRAAVLFLVSVLALALKSSFFDWCAEYFKDPQMRVCLTTKLLFRRLSEVELKQTVADEPGSVLYNC